MGARHLGRPQDAGPLDGGVTSFGDITSFGDEALATSFGDEALATPDESEEGPPTDLWSLPRDVVVAPSGTDTLVAAWSGALAPTGDDVASLPERDFLGVGLAGSGGGELDLGAPRVDARRARRTQLVTLLVTVSISAAVGVAALPLIGVLASDVRIGGPAQGASSSNAVDDRIVVQGPSVDCLTMLVKPREDGTAADTTGTCFSVG